MTDPKPTPKPRQPLRARLRMTDADWVGEHDPCQGRCCRGNTNRLAQPGDLYGGRND